MCNCMKLKVQKDNVNDPTYIEVDELLKGCVKELPDLSKYASKAHVDELMERVKSLSFLLHKGVFDLVAPINITSFSEIEAINEVQEGVIVLVGVTVLVGVIELVGVIVGV